MVKMIARGPTITTKRSRYISLCDKRIHLKIERKDSLGIFTGRQVGRN